MESNFLTSLSEGEAEELKTDIEQAQAKILARRESAKIEALIVEYKTAMLAARGKRHELASIRERYARKGVPVSEVIF